MCRIFSNGSVSGATIAFAPTHASRPAGVILYHTLLHDTMLYSIPFYVILFYSVLLRSILSILFCSILC